MSRPVSGDLSTRVSEVLAAEVLDRLHQLDLIAAGQRHSTADLAQIRREMRRMVGMWRSLLDEHRADDGSCPRCRTWCGQRRRWPCPVWMAAHTSLTTRDPDRPEPPRPTGTAPAGWAGRASYP